MGCCQFFWDRKCGSGPTYGRAYPQKYNCHDKNGVIGTISLSMMTPHAAGRPNGRAAGLPDGRRSHPNDRRQWRPAGQPPQHPHAARRRRPAGQPPHPHAARRQPPHPHAARRRRRPAVFKLVPHPHGRRPSSRRTHTLLDGGGLAVSWPAAISTRCSVASASRPAATPIHPRPAGQLPCPHASSSS